MNVLQIKNHLFKMNGLGRGGGTQVMYFEKAIFGGGAAECLASPAACGVLILRT